MASTGGGDGMPARMPMPAASTSTAQLKQNRDARALEAIQMKDEQLRILTEQNSQLIRSLDAVEDQANSIQLEKLACDEENKSLRDKNFELQSRARSAEAAFKKLEQQVGDKDKQLQIMTDQNAELLRLLETEENQSGALERQLGEIIDAHEALKGKYSSLLTTAKTHEEMAARAAREGQLRAEELRLLRAECEQLRSQNAEMERKAAVEVETLQEQLRVRKEKQYHLLEKMQSAEEARRQAQDQNQTMVDKAKALHSRVVELETQLQVETRSKRAQEEANRNLSVTEENLRRANAELQTKTEKAEQERLRMEAEARDASEQLREMAEKVFQLLERLKLAELGKSKAVESVRKSEQEMQALKKKNVRLLKESTEEGKLRIKAELDKKVLIDQIRTLKMHNTQLAQRCKQEVKLKLREHEERRKAEEKVQTLGGRLSFLLNKLQADEEAKIVNKEELKKMTAQLKVSQEKIQELLAKLNATGESNRIITQALRMKQEEVESVQIKYDALDKQLQRVLDGDEDLLTGSAAVTRKRDASNGDEAKEGGVAELSIDQVRESGGRGRFFIDPRPTQGYLLIKAHRAKTTEMISRLDINGFLKRCQKSSRFKEMVIEKLAHVLGLLSVEEDDRSMVAREAENRLTQIDFLVRKTAFMQDKLQTEEEAKRQTLLRYVNVVKSSVRALKETMGLVGETTFDEMDVANLPLEIRRKGVVQLANGGVGDEEVHALAALLRGSNDVYELVLRNNTITDDGARALGAILDGSCPSMSRVDLRGNCISRIGVRIIAEALERSSAVRHVYVHAGGKVEALGTGTWTGGVGGTKAIDDEEDDKANKDKQESSSTVANESTVDKAGDDDDEAKENEALVTVVTVCVVDIRDNNPDRHTLDPSLDLDGVKVSGRKKRKKGGGTITEVGHVEKPTRGGNKADTTSGNGKIRRGGRGKKYNGNISTSTSTSTSKPNSSDSHAEITPPMLTPEEKKAKKEQSAKRREEKEVAIRQTQIREEKWEGRAGGMDVPREVEVLRQQQLAQLKRNEVMGGGAGAGSQTSKRLSVKRGSGRLGGNSVDDNGVSVRASTPTSIPEDGFPPVASAEPRPTTAIAAGREAEDKTEEASLEIQDVEDQESKENE